MARMDLVACKQCGKERLVQRSYMLKPWFTGLCQDCARHSRVRQGNPNWKEGQYKSRAGYVYIRLYPDNPYYPMATKHDHYVREHRLVMARHLGRCLLRSELVHHKNRIRDDNRIENLELVEPNGYHRIEYKKGYRDGYLEGLKQAKKEWNIEKT